MAHSPGDQFRYLRSFGEELSSQANRVRDLIGSRHWASDGRHKERILAATLRKYLPTSLALSSGFVISPVDPMRCSKEQDLLVVDTWGSAPILNEDHLVIAFPSATLGAISVKTQLRKTELQDALEGLATVRSLCGPNSLWAGAFFYDVPDAFDADELVRKLVELLPAVAKTITPCIPTGQPVPFGPDLITTAGDVAIQLDYSRDECTSKVACTVRPFTCDGMAPTLLLAGLLEHIGTARGNTYQELNAFIERQSFRPLSPPQRVFLPV